MARLQLEVREFRDLTRWRWVVTDSSKALLADHEVRLDAASWQYEAFRDLRWYLRWHCAPDRRAEDEARIVGEVGAWIGMQVLGPAVAATLVKRHPATVRVVVPPEAAELLYRPLELAHVNGKPLAVQDVTLIMESRTGAARIEPVGERLRVLGLFSLPEGGRPLNLRRERAELVRLVRGIAATGKAADVRVLQYGVTRNRLREVLEEAEGWDIIHVSGHGRPGSLTLETAVGSPDRVTATELAGLLGPARERLKLVTVSACWSAAKLADAERRLLDFPVHDQDRDDPPERDRGDSPPFTSSGALASELTRQLGCAVLAMRYPVGDDFAIAMSEKLYDLLARQGQLLPRAVGMTLRQLSTETGRTGSAGSMAGNGSGSGMFPALSMAALALFGGLAADLRLAAPTLSGSASYGTAQLKMTGFPPEPFRFVGRTGVLARSSAALAPRSGILGILLHGMPGGGKTACALELAYGHEEAFDRLIWYKAPDEGTAIDGALTDFALTLERYLPGFQMVHFLASAETLTAFIPRLKELLERRRVLIVIDNTESLLSTGGAWHDDRWAMVIGALTGHTGTGRVILTSRRLPAAGLPGLRVESVGALSADEALLLARELPNLSALKLGNVPGLGTNVSRVLARNAIATARGHPKLLELAEGQAANPEHLLQLVKTGDQAWRRLGDVPDGFFAGDERSASGEDYLKVLAIWTKAITDTLTPGERDLFWFLCCLEDLDRIRPVVSSSWAALWIRLGRDDQLPELDQALSIMSVCGLTDLRPHTTGRDEFYAIHPGIAAAGRNYAGSAFQHDVDRVIAEYWINIYGSISGKTGDNVNTRLIVRAGLSGFPYLTRLEEWAAAYAIVGEAVSADPSRATAAALLPALEKIARHDARAAITSAEARYTFDPSGAEAQLRSSLEAAMARSDHMAALQAEGLLSDFCRTAGRLAEALDIAEQIIIHTKQAGLDPWLQLSAEVQRLQVLSSMGRHKQVIGELKRISNIMHNLSAPDNVRAKWDVEEALAHLGCSASTNLRKWNRALEFNAIRVEILHHRGAVSKEIADALYNNYGPLVNLGRIDEALDLLMNCREVYDDSGDLNALGDVLGGLAHIESLRGHGEAAVRLERDALRYRYMAGHATGIGNSYHNLGEHLRRHFREADAGLACACQFAASLIRILTRRNVNSGLASGPPRVTAPDLRAFGPEIVLPRGVADLCLQVGDIPGADLPGLIARLSPDPEIAEKALRGLIAQAQEAAGTPNTDLLA